MAYSEGCNFFDTALSYGDGHSERMLRRLREGLAPGSKLYTATKISPQNEEMPTRRGSRLEQVFPPDHIRMCTEQSLNNLGLDTIDLMQFHAWEDAWAQETSWQEAVQKLKSDGLVCAWGISVNRWEPWNVMDTLRTGLIDSVQVTYNIFDQSPRDELFPLCLKLDVAVIARSPFDEGSLTGAVTKDSTWPEGDWRNVYFTKENLSHCAERVEALSRLLPADMTMAELALKFILADPAVATVIPGMRRLKHVESNVGASDGQILPRGLLLDLASHRWNREIPNSKRRGLREGL
jgi:aryl-alcohol dehydrogenase-like predicted oxidoreductase